MQFVLLLSYLVTISNGLKLISSYGGCPLAPVKHCPYLTGSEEAKYLEWTGYSRSIEMKLVHSKEDQHYVLRKLFIVWDRPS